VVLKPEHAGELRTMVREVLREAMAGKSPPGLSAVESVRIASDGELHAFVARLLDPAVQEMIKSGKLRFVLAGASAAPGGALSGVVTEKAINKHASAGTLVLAPDAVLTPLARDRARKLGLKIERRR
jgi:hypothetical protein